VIFLAEALEWRLCTEGAFTPERSDDVLDSSGLVKGHAIREAGTSLLALGLTDWCLNAGGDVLVSGSPGPGGDDLWHAGIVALLTAAPCSQAAPWVKDEAAHSIAHVRFRGEGRQYLAASASGPDFVQVSVLANDIVTADVLATAIIAGGVPMLNRATDGSDVDVLAVRTDGQLLATPGFRAEAA
jgi:thiamine biosynthesis lipoprotein